MPSPTDLIEGTLRFLRILHGVLLFSIFLYVVTAEKFVPHQPRVFNQGLLIGFGIFSLSLIGTAFLARLKMIQPALDALQARPDDSGSLNRWRAGTIMSYVLAESVAFLGFTLRFIGGTLPQSLPFYTVAIALMLFWWPRRP